MGYFGYTPAGQLLHRLEESVASKMPWPPEENRLALTMCDRLVLNVKNVRELTDAEAEEHDDLCRRCQRRYEREAKIGWGSAGGRR